MAVKTEISVSLCLITRNEERRVASCIDSVRHLVQEIIVVDTGSSDRTVELVRQKGARVFTFSWRDDFAAARNYALDRATGEWILVLDADEILEPVEPEEFARLLAAPEVEGYFVKICSYLGEGKERTEDQVVRLFRNRPAYRFQGAIHEQVAGAIKRHNGGEGLALSPLVIHHFGYLDREVKAGNKRQRNISLLKKALAGRPDDPFLLFSLGIEYFQGGEIAKGVGQLEKALALMRGGEGYFRDLLVTLGLGLLKTGQRDRLALLLDKALLMLPGDPDLHLLKGVLALGEGRYAAAAGALQSALAAESRLLPAHHVHTLLGDACNILGRFKEAEDEYLSALRLVAHNLYPLAQVLGLKQRGAGGLGWLELSRFATPAAKRVIINELIRLTEFPMALVVVLLAVIEAAAAGDGGELLEVCRVCNVAVQRCVDNASGQELGGEYLRTSAGEMLLYAEAAQRGLSCGLFSPAQKLFRLAADALEIVVNVLCPAWRPRKSFGVRRLKFEESFTTINRRHRE
ncbi:MAG: glycosyltransferase [Ammonifex sp.]|nr:MAG: glycosyltransferase [Ammonifex sp.]